MEAEISPEKKVARPEVAPTEIAGELEITILPPVSVPAFSFFPAITRMASVVSLEVVRLAPMVTLSLASSKIVPAPALRGALLESPPVVFSICVPELIDPLPPTERLSSPSKVTDPLPALIEPFKFKLSLASIFTEPLFALVLRTLELFTVTLFTASISIEPDVIFAPIVTPPPALSVSAPAAELMVAFTVMPVPASKLTAPPLALVSIVLLIVIAPLSASKSNEPAVKSPLTVKLFVVSSLRTPVPTLIGSFTARFLPALRVRLLPEPLVIPLVTVRS